jgi:hypothetical protein
MVGADGSVRTTPGFPEFAPAPAAAA